MLQICCCYLSSFALLFFNAAAFLTLYHNHTKSAHKHLNTKVEHISYVRKMPNRQTWKVNKNVKKRKRENTHTQSGMTMRLFYASVNNGIDHSMSDEQENKKTTSNSGWSHIFNLFIQLLILSETDGHDADESKKNNSSRHNVDTYSMVDTRYVVAPYSGSLHTRCCCCRFGACMKEDTHTCSIIGEW